MCLFSSGILADGKGTKCNVCGGSGKVTKAKLNEFNDIHGFGEKKKYVRENLTRAEKKIYDSVMQRFPATHPESAYDIAIQNGIQFQFICK